MSHDVTLHDLHVRFKHTSATCRRTEYVQSLAESRRSLTFSSALSDRNRRKASSQRARSGGETCAESLRSLTKFSSYTSVALRREDLSTTSSEV